MDLKKNSWLSYMNLGKMTAINSIKPIFPNHIQADIISKKTLFSSKKFLNSDLSRQFTLICTTPDELQFDSRAHYCCKIKCPNYDTRCYCPPHSLRYTQRAMASKSVLILAKTYDFSRLKHFISQPNDLNSTYLFKNRVYVRRWVQHDFYSLIKQVMATLNCGSDVFIAGGFSDKKCIKCFSNENVGTRHDRCKPMPSPEALGIDVKGTLDRLGYFIDFGVKTKMTKVAMLFFEFELDLTSKPIIGLLDRPFTQQITPKLDLINVFRSFNSILDLKLVPVTSIQSYLRPEFDWLKNWKHALMWDSSPSKSKKLGKKIHETTFLDNHPFALDFFTKDIFLTDIGFTGIEFID